ncbi:hypothetical protein L1049_002439 [Liquidambar formosana]|uniref:Uncharacterized protein n=1 Tax=Liquidambar formosana TaxID=63359 RepID=A0AAP0R7F1_LIQFO
MATLQKFKLLATQCAVAGSPTRSPTTSPVIHLRRRRTLRMFLSRNTNRRFSRRDDSPDRHRLADTQPEKKSNNNSSNKENLTVSHKLKDLFVSSSPPLEKAPEKVRDVKQGFLPETGSVGSDVGLAWRRGGAGSFRPISGAFRHRLLRRAWRPVLGTIPE